MTKHYVVELPRLGGVRESAAKLAESLPAELTGAEVVIDAGGNATCSQGFVDELLKQILEVRNAEQVTVRHANDHLRVYANLSGVKRSYLNRLILR